MRLTWINGTFPRGRRAPRRSSGLGATADREASRGREEEEEEENDDDDDDAPPRLASQKAAPLVVRVIDDRENMRARKKDPPLAASLLRGTLSARGPRDCHADCSGSCHGLPET